MQENEDCLCSVFQGERGTGYGVALLLSLFGNNSDNPLLKSVAPTTQVWRQYTMKQRIKTNWMACNFTSYKYLYNKLCKVWDICCRNVMNCRNWRNFNIGSSTINRCNQRHTLNNFLYMKYCVGINFTQKLWSGRFKIPKFLLDFCLFLSV